MLPEKNGHTILVGEDEFEVRAYLEMALQCLGYSVELAEDGEEVINNLRSPGPRVSAVLLDLRMPQRDGMDVLREIRHIDSSLPVIIVSGAASPVNVVTAMRTGATDFLSKPVAHEDLRSALGRALEDRVGVMPAPPAPPKSDRGSAFFGSTARMREIQALIPHVGWSEAPVLIQGETGSGKEVLARELHAQSPRSGQVFLKVNCAALPSELVESELFGYERGAFTGAFQRKIGIFEAANGGTILLDEIGDMNIRLQAKLLQVLQDREFQRIGGRDTIQVDVRIMTATHCDLERAVAEGDFRKDLYYRLNVVTLHLPPLRERKEDIARLAEHLLSRHAPPGDPIAITPDLKQAMITYHWPGNVRELENIVRRLIVLRDPGRITRDLYAKASRLPLVSPGIGPTPPVKSVASSDAPPMLEQVTRAKQQAEVEAIRAALHSTCWNRKQAAALLKIDYKALLYKMKKLGVEDYSLSPAGSPIEAPGDGSQ